VFAEAKLRKSADAQALLDRYDASGGELGAYAITELQKQTLQPLLDQLRGEVDKADNEGAIAHSANAVSLIFHGRVRDFTTQLLASRGAGAVRKAANAMIAAYQAEDQVFRFATWLKAVNEGKTDLAAGKLAREAFLDYSINAPWIQNARATMLPFIAFAYRAAPMLLRAIAEKPWKLMRYAAYAGGLNALSYAFLGLGGGDEDRERQLLPDEKSGNIWGVFPRLMRMPWNVNDQPVFLDIRRWIPVGDVIDFGQHEPAVPIPATLFPGGPLVTLFELILNKSAFDGKPITLETDTPVEQARKVRDYLYRWITPNAPWIPWSYSWQNIVDAGSGKTDAFGRELDLRQAIQGSFGIKEGTYPADVLEKNLEGKLSHDEMELDMEFSKVTRQYQRHGISDAEYDDAIARHAEKKAKLQQALEKKLSGSQQSE
jgi:hypothetical protein